MRLDELVGRRGLVVEDLPQNRKKNRVMPKDISTTVIDDLERVLKPGGYWFIKMNPYYSKEELESFEYKNAGNNIYEKDHIMRLRQAITNYWKEKFARFGKEIIYLEFEYPWQEGMNRLFVYQS